MLGEKMSEGAGGSALIVGVTGNSGCGQTTAADCVADYCSGVCSLDETGHRLLERKYVVTDLAMRLCRPDLMRFRGESLRRELRRTVFEDPEQLAGLNSVLHPRMVSWAVRSAALIRSRFSGIYVLEGALLLELGLAGLLDLLIVVSDTPERCAARAGARDGMPEKAVLERWRHQMDLGEKEAAADVVIRNSGSKDDMCREIVSIFAQM